MIVTVSFNICADLSGIHDLPTNESLNIYRTPFNPLPGEGVKQLVYRLGTTYNEIESKLDTLLTTSFWQDYLEIEQVQSHCPTILYASDFGTSGTTIDQPGYYILCGDVAWTAADNMSAITTATNHVTIDLNNHAIYQTNKGSVSNVNGITINQGIHDVTIKNGTLSDFTTYGITGTRDNKNITIENVLIENPGDGGINFNPVSASGCIGLTISNCMVNGSGAFGLSLGFCSDVGIINCSFIQNTNKGLFVGSVSGGHACSKCRFVNCHFDNNNYWGAGIYDSQEILFDSCTFNKNEKIGLKFSRITGTCEGIIVQNCQAIGNTYSGGDYAAGFDTFGTISGIVFKNCVANCNESSISYGLGFWLYQSQECRIEQCIAENNKGTQAYGIFVSESAQDNLIIDCKTNNNNATTPTLGYGIKVESDSDNTTIENCEAFSNSGYGISNESPTSIITGCVSGNNGTASFGGTNGTHYARRNKFGNHFEIGEQENIALETSGINEVGCVTYLDAAATGTIGYAIQTPGHYILCEDLKITCSVSVLSIESDFVTLDLNGKAITCASTMIDVESGHHDIIIKNGKFLDFCSYGIYVSPNCHHIDIENVDMSRSNTICHSAIRFNGTGGNEIHDCTIKNCRVTEITTRSNGKVMILNYCNDIQIIDSHFNHNTYTDGITPFPAVYSVISLNNSDKCQFINCQFNDNKSTDKDLDLYSISLLGSDSVLIDRCTFNNNISKKKWYGIACYTALSSKYLTNGSIIRNSVFNNNIATTNLTGIYLPSPTSGNNRGNVIESCLISNNSAGSMLYGIYLEPPFVTDSANGNIISNCCIRANNAGTTCYGINIGGEYNAIIGCEITYNTGTTAYGINITTTCSQTLVQDCVSFGNTTAGIYNDGTNSIIIGCDAANNGSDYAGTPGALAVSFYKTGYTVPQPTYRYDNAEFTL